MGTNGVKHVLWLTYRTNTAYVLPGGIAARDLYGSHNSELARRDDQAHA